jgi:hypothetical protein
MMNLPQNVFSRVEETRAKTLVLLICEGNFSVLFDVNFFVKENFLVLFDVDFFVKENFLVLF